MGVTIKILPKMSINFFAKGSFLSKFIISGGDLMNSNYLSQKNKALKSRHYILKTNLPNYFFNFRPNVVKQYFRDYGENFMLICWKDKSKLDAYFIPYKEAKRIFCSENLTTQNNTKSERWLGTINGHILSLGGNKLLDVEKHFNRITSYEALVGK